MKRLYLIIILLSSIIVCEAQTPFEQIVKAENTFEQQCLKLGIKKGFLANLDSSAIAFTRDSIENAKDYWKSLPHIPGIYSWAPTYAEVSASGDWGYTTGAVEYREGAINDTPSAYNQYTTVWHKNKNGEWKYLADIGNTHGPVPIDRTPAEIKVRKIPKRNLTQQSVLDLEQSYHEHFKSNPETAIKKYFSKTFILNFSGSALTTSIDTALNLFKSVAEFMDYEPVDVRLSPAGDMASVSGYINHGYKRKHYLRVWRHESSGWKIALEVTKI